VLLDVLVELALLNLQSLLLGREIGDPLLDVLELVAHLFVRVVE